MTSYSGCSWHSVGDYSNSLQLKIHNKCWITAVLVSTIKPIFPDSLSQFLVADKHIIQPSNFKKLLLANCEQDPFYNKLHYIQFLLSKQYILYVITLKYKHHVLQFRYL